MQENIIPWLSPSLSQSMAGVLTSLGHSVTFARGDVIYSSPGFFEKLMFVRSGFVVKALLDPIREEPLLLSLAGPGSFCGSYENLYVRDRMLRRHWCMTTTEVLVVNQELLLKIADQMPEWQRELSGYSSASALCDRMGMYLVHSGSLEERLGALLVLMVRESVPDSQSGFASRGVQWIEMPFMPGMSTVARIIGSNLESVQELVRRWVSEDVIRMRKKKIWLKREVFARHWDWLSSYLQQQSH